MKSAWALAALLLLLPVFGNSAENRDSSRVELRIQSVSGKACQWRAPFQCVMATLDNVGTDSVELVEPGDGSWDGWRMPLVRWDVRDTDGHVLRRAPYGRCGNVNPLRPGDVFTLAPGQSREILLLWDPSEFACTKGWYELRLTYENRPGMRWVGLPLEPHDPAAMKRAHESTACSLVSNTLRVHVKKTLR